MTSNINVKKSAIKFWGLYWASLHYLSYIYPINPTDEQKEQVYKLIEIMKKNGILCVKCKNHFIIWCSNHDIKSNYNSRDELINYFIDLHNNVNQRNKKRLFSRKEVDSIYDNFIDSVLIDYKINVKILFNENKIYELPDIINSFTRQKLLVEFGIIDFA